MNESFFLSIAIITIVVVLLSLLNQKLKQPPIIGYIVAGVLLSPYGFNIVGTGDSLEIFSHMGVSFLLFMVGLSLNPRIVKDVGKAAVLTGLGQIIFTSVFGYVIALILGFSATESLYLSIALTFSSTIIIMKLLSDKGELESLYGRIATGFLIVQDIVAMLLLVVISAFQSGSSFENIFMTTLGIFGGLLGILTIVGISIVPRLLKSVSKSQELLLLFSIAWCLGVSALFQHFKLSAEMGALLAGVTLSLSPYRFEIASKLRPLRDFFIVIFFVLLGSKMVFDNFSNHVVPIVAFSLFVLIGNPLIVLIIMGLLGYSKRNSFRAGLTVAQISEFSFILITLGMRVGHLSPTIVSLVTFVGLITIAGSTYFIIYADKLCALLEKPLSWFERKGKKVDQYEKTEQKYDILLLGYERVTFHVVEMLLHKKRSFQVIDFDPVKIQNLQSQGIPYLYGDLGDSDFLNEINFIDAKMVVATIRDFDTSVLIVRRIRASNNNAIIIVLAQHVDEALYLYEAGATYVITPQFLSGYHTSMLIEECGLDMEKFILEKIKHIKHLKRIPSPHH